MKHLEPQQRKVFSQLGFSLIEVLVVMGIISLISLAIATLVSSVTGQQEHLTKAFEKQKTIDNVRATVSASDLCAARLGIAGMAIASPMNLASISMINGEVLQVGVPNPDMLQADSITLVTAPIAGTERKQEPSTYATPTARNYVRHTGNLNIVIEKSQAGAAGLSTFRAVSLPIILLVNPNDGLINYCYSAGNFNDDVCTDMFNATYDPARNPKCRMSSFAISDFHFDQITDAGAGASKTYLQDSLAVFGATPRLRLQEGTTAAAPAVLSGGTNTFAEIAYGGNNLTITPPYVAGVAPSLFFGSATRTAAFSGLLVSVNRTVPTPAGPMFTVNSTLNTNPAVSVTGTSTFNGNMTLQGAANAQLLTVTGTLGFQTVDITGNIHATGNLDIDDNAAYGIISARQVITPSDRRLKQDIHVITDALNKISQIQGVTYLWKDLSNPDQQIGVIAQDVQKVFPEAVHTNEDGYLRVNYSVLVGPLIEAVKELKSEQDDLKSQLDELRREIASLKNKKPAKK